MSKKKILITFLVFLLTGFIFYVQKYQQLISEGAGISDERCIKINPLIIQRKNKFLEGIKYLKAGDTDSYIKSLTEYKNITYNLIKEDKKFLQTYQDYLNRKDFQYLIDKRVVNMVTAQFELYSAEHESSVALNRIEDDKSQTEEVLLEIFLWKQEKAKEAEEKYKKLWEEKHPFDYRSLFIKIPPSKCPEENRIFPDTDNPFAPQVPDLPFST